MGELRLRLAPGVHVGAEDGVHDVVQTEVLHDLLGVGVVLVGVDGDPDAPGLQAGEDLAAAGVGAQAMIHDRREMLAEEAGGRRRVGLAGELDDGDVHGAADGAPDLLQGHAREAHHPHHVVIAAVDGLEVVDQRAVEVEKDGFREGAGHG